MLGITLALCAGLCAAVASSFAKIAMSPAIIRSFVCKNGKFLSIIKETNLSDDNYCDWVVVVFRVLSFSLVFVFNALMWTLFVKSLRKCPSTAVATVTNTGSNLVCTAILGIILFGETQSIQWWMGASLIVTGLVIIHDSNQTRDETSEKDKTQ